MDSAGLRGRSDGAYDNANVAVAHMVDTATHSQQLKQAAGIKGGRPLQTPVYCYSLAWHTSESPTQAEQVTAARETLKRLGVDDRQSIIIGHDDTDHRHVHIMVNRVCPSTGRAAKMGNDRLILSDWAHEYREERGELHFCPNREENRKNRKDGFVKDQSMTRQEWVAWKKAQTGEIWKQHRADRDKASPTRKGQYDALWRQKEERFALRRDEIKQLYKPIWRDVFKRQKQALKDFDASLVGRIKFVLGYERGKMAGLLSALVGKKDLRAEFIRKQESDRKEIAAGQKARITDASKEVTKAWKYDRDELKDMHSRDDERAKQATQTRVDDLWKDKTPEQTQPEFREKSDRRRDDNKTRRQSLEAFYGDDKEGLEKARARKKARSERKTRERKRTRGRGGRTMER